MTLTERAIVLCATGLMIGKIPVAPGTFGTAAGIPLCLLAGAAGPLPSAVLIIIFILVAVWIADRAAAVLQAKDPGCIVIDEMAGILVTLWGLPTDTIMLAAGFVLFRVLDIAKPFPIGRLERLPGGIGVVADDVAAGVVGNVLLRLALAAFGPSG